MFEAFLFDLDGTLVDSDPLHLLAFAAYLEPAGYRVDEAFFHARIHGRTVPEVFAEFRPEEDPRALDRAKEATFRELLAERSVPVTPGAAELLDLAAANALPCAIATNGSLANAEAVLARIGLRARFGAVISAEQCLRGKPAPDPYLAAAEAIGADPRRSLAFEDSAAGVTSARAAGCTVVGLTTALGPADLQAAGAHRTIADFRDPQLADLMRLPAA